jgi:hypothetical protein
VVLGRPDDRCACCNPDCKPHTPANRRTHVSSHDCTFSVTNGITHRCAVACTDGLSYACSGGSAIVCTVICPEFGADLVTDFLPHVYSVCVTVSVSIRCPFCIPHNRAVCVSDYTAVSRTECVPYKFTNVHSLSGTLGGAHGVPNA